MKENIVEYLPDKRVIQATIGRQVITYIFIYTSNISCMNKTTCSSDQFPTRLLMSHIHAIVPILQHIVNLCLATGDFPISCKSSIVIPLIKKPGLDREM